MNQNRKELINRFQKWLDTNPRKQLIAAQCATIAEEYHKEQLKLYGVVGQGEQLKCQCKKAKFTRTVDADFNPLCGRCGKAL